MKNILFIFLFTSGFALAQTFGNNIVKSHAQVETVYSEIPIEGTPFLDNIYRKGETVINGKVQRVALMRYNALNDYIEILDENNQPRKLLRRANIIATFGGNTYLVTNYKNNGKTKFGYFNPLNTGNTVLYYHPKKKFVQAQKPDNGYDQIEPPTYKDVSLYYLKHGDLVAEEIKLNKRSLLKALSDKSDKLKTFIANHDLNLRNKKDVITLIKYYNTLQSGTLEKKAES